MLKYSSLKFLYTSNKLCKSMYLVDEIQKDSVVLCLFWKVLAFRTIFLKFIRGLLKAKLSFSFIVCLSCSCRSSEPQQYFYYIQHCMLFFQEEDRKLLVGFLEDVMTMLSLSHAPLDSLKASFVELG